MSPQLIGAMIGAVMGLAAFIALRSVADRVERNDKENGARVAGILRTAAVAEIVILTLMGAFIGPLIFGET
jgi:hypothetical protein